MRAETPLRSYRDFVIFTSAQRRRTSKQLRRFSVRVLQSPVGEGEREEWVDIEDYEHLLTQSQRLGQRLLDDNPREQMELGCRLGWLLLPKYARSLYSRSLDALGPGQGLRLRLRLLNELSPLPWEFMLVQETEGELDPGSFLLFNPRVSIVRHEAMAVAADLPPPGESRRAVVVIMATPKPFEKYPELKNLPAEQSMIKEKLGDKWEVKCLPEYGERAEEGVIVGAQPQQVEPFIRAVRPDIFHFSGHGAFEQEVGPRGTVIGLGSIILADERNQAVELPSHELARILRENGVRLVTLAACETGQKDPLQLWSGTAAALMKGRIPAVVAMQFRVNSTLANTFMEAFYDALATPQCCVDQAVSIGRSAMRIKAATTKGVTPDARDWGVPVLYCRVPDLILPPIADDDARRAAQARSDRRIQLQEAWWNWLTQGIAPSRDQLDYLSERAADIDLSVTQMLLLLRAAVDRNRPATRWLNRLRQEGAAAIRQLDEPGAPVPPDLKEAVPVLGLDADMQKNRPQGCGALAWAAACHDEATTRHTAALALSAMSPSPALGALPEPPSDTSTAAASVTPPPLPSGAPPTSSEGFSRLDKALSTGQARQACGGLLRCWWRRMELRGAVADADPSLEGVGAGLPLWERFGIWLWRFLRRARSDQDRIQNLALGAGAGAGLLIGLWRALTRLPGSVPFMVAQEFTINLFFGFLLGAAVGLGVGLARPMLHRQDGSAGATSWLCRIVGPGKAPSAVACLLGIVLFGVTHLLVCLINGLHLPTGWPVVGTGCLVGLGINLALWGLPRTERKPGWWGWIVRLAFAAFVMALAQQLLVWSRFSDWQAMSVSRTGSFYASEVLAKMGCSSLLPTWQHRLSIFDALVVGGLLASGIGLGLNVAEQRWMKWRDLLEHTGG